MQLAVSVELVRTLRDQTGAGIMNCKEALETSGGDLEKAVLALREKGIASVAKRVGRATNEGVIETYLHTGGRVGAMVELGCETDFVARTDEFQKLAHDIAMQVAAMGPVYVDQDEIEEGDARPPAQISLMQQPFIKNSSSSVGEMVKELAAKVGENVRVVRFSRLAVGE
ncbi:MAG: elongation factor Ts [Chloroflexi bacterium]|nr:elongation factor Ts [Chloroflexota bacterium]MCH8799582.1 elongation factor Ts [Chloroflexota bacterium]